MRPKEWRVGNEKVKVQGKKSSTLTAVAALWYPQNHKVPPARNVVNRPLRTSNNSVNAHDEHLQFRKNGLQYPCNWSNEFRE
jgi:flagellar basal body rod protein FlgB